MHIVVLMYAKRYMDTFGCEYTYCHTYVCAKNVLMFVNIHTLVLIYIFKNILMCVKNNIVVLMHI